MEMNAQIFSIEKENGMGFHLRGCDAWPTQFPADCWVEEHPNCQYTAK